MFIPAVAAHIMKENNDRIAKKSRNEWLMPLGGAALGNGWIVRYLATLYNDM
jgi:hypothetical protein